MLDIHCLSPERLFAYCMFKAKHNARCALYTAKYTFPSLKLDTVEEWYDEFKNNEYTANTNIEGNDEGDCRGMENDSRKLFVEKHDDVDSEEVDEIIPKKQRKILSDSERYDEFREKSNREDIESINEGKSKKNDEEDEKVVSEENDEGDCEEMDENSSDSPYRLDFEEFAKRLPKKPRKIMSDTERYDNMRAIAEKDPSFLDYFGPSFKLPSPGYPSSTMNVAINLDLHGILIEKKLNDGPNEATWFKNCIHPNKPQFNVNTINDSLKHLESILNEPEVKIEEFCIRYMNCEMLEDEQKLLSNGIQAVLNKMERKLIVSDLEIEVGDGELLEAFLANIKHGYLKSIIINNHLIQVNKVAEVSRILNSGHWRYLQLLSVPCCQLDVSFSQLIDVNFNIMVTATQEDLKKYIVQKVASDPPAMAFQRMTVDHERLTKESFEGSNKVTTACDIFDFCVIDNTTGVHCSVQSDGEEILIMKCLDYN